jgi:hypothetical protein
LKLSNDCYVIRIQTRNSTECYYRDERGWLKESSRGRKYRATAEQVLNHILPVLAGVKPGLTLSVSHHDLLPASEDSPPSPNPT